MWHWQKFFTCFRFRFRKKNLPWNHGEDALARFDPAKYFDDVSIFNASELPDRGIGVLRAMPCPEMRWKPPDFFWDGERLTPFLRDKKFTVNHLILFFFLLFSYAWIHHYLQKEPVSQKGCNEQYAGWWATIHWAFYTPEDEHAT